MDKTHKIRVTRLSGNEVLSGMGKIDHFYNRCADGGPAKLDVDFVGQQYPSTETLWLEAEQGNVVVQAQVTVDYTSSICSEHYTSFNSVPGTVRTFDKRHDLIPCGPNCVFGHRRG